jgi:hypothetical protein
MNALHANLNENMSMVPQNNNPHLGSSFDDFLKEQNIFEEVHPRVTRCLLNKYPATQALPPSRKLGQSKEHGE